MLEMTNPDGYTDTKSRVLEPEKVLHPDACAIA